MSITIGMAPRFEADNITTKVFYKTSYIEALNNYHYNIKLLSYIPSILETQIEECDGFLIPGGNDVDPSLYHQPLDASTVLCNPLESFVEKEILDHAVRSKKPILGICKGIQIINVFFGGSLYQDIPNHQNVYHNIHINERTCQVNSFHHQAIKTLAPTFNAIATSDDGIIEAIVHSTLPIIAIQLHPELDLSDPINRYVFDEFQTLLMK